MTQSNEAAERSYHAPARTDMTGNGVLVEVEPGVFKLSVVARLEAERDAARLGGWHAALKAAASVLDRMKVHAEAQAEGAGIPHSFVEAFIRDAECYGEAYDAIRNLTPPEPGDG